MARVRILSVLLLVGVLVIGAATLQGTDRGAATHRGDAPRVAVVPPVSYSLADVPGQANALSRRASAAVPRLVSPRPHAGLRMTFPRTWRPVALELRSPVPKPPLRVFCATCPPGTVLEFDL